MGGSIWRSMGADASLYFTPRRATYRLKDNYDKRKLVLPMFPYTPGVPQIQPTEELVATFEKKFVR